MEEVNIQVQLTGRPYLTLKPAVTGRAVPQGWGRRVPLSCVPGRCHHRKPGIFLSKGMELSIILERAFTHLDGWLKDQLTGLGVDTPTLDGGVGELGALTLECGVTCVSDSMTPPSRSLFRCAG